MLTAFFLYSIILLPDFLSDSDFGIPDAMYYVLFSVCLIIILSFYSVSHYLLHRWFYLSDAQWGTLDYFKILSVRFQLKIIYLHFLGFSKRFSDMLFYLLPFVSCAAVFILKLRNGGLDSRMFGLTSALTAVFFFLGLYYLLAVRQKTAFCDELLAEDKTLSAREVLRQSTESADSRCFELARFKLSFSAWYILCPLIFPIFFVMPYYLEALSQYKKTDLEKQGL